MDPNLDQTHPDPGAMVRLLCAANRQARRGYFKSRVLMDNILGPKTVSRLVDRCDVVLQDDGSWYVPGWKEWQEGGITGGERHRRLRARRNGADVTEPLSDRDDSVTVP